MINIKVNNDGKRTDAKCEIHIEGRKNAVIEFYAVIKALADADENVFADALDTHIRRRLDEMHGGDDNDESES